MENLPLEMLSEISSTLDARTVVSLGLVNQRAYGWYLAHAHVTGVQIAQKKNYNQLLEAAECQPKVLKAILNSEYCTAGFIRKSYRQCDVNYECLKQFKHTALHVACQHNQTSALLLINSKWCNQRMFEDVYTSAITEDILADVIESNALHLAIRSSQLLTVQGILESPYNNGLINSVYKETSNWVTEKWNCFQLAGMYSQEILEYLLTLSEFSAQEFI